MGQKKKKLETGFAIMAEKQFRYFAFRMRTWYNMGIHEDILRMNTSGQEHAEVERER